MNYPRSKLRGIEKTRSKAKQVHLVAGGIFLPVKLFILIMLPLILDVIADCCFIAILADCADIVSV